MRMTELYTCAHTLALLVVWKWLGRWWAQDGTIAVQIPWPAQCVVVIAYHIKIDAYIVGITPAH